MTNNSEKTQFNQNVAAYEQLDADFIQNNSGKTALFADGVLIETYNDKMDAYKIGIDKFGAGNFSIKEIGEKPKSLGVISHYATFSA